MRELSVVAARRRRRVNVEVFPCIAALVMVGACTIPTDFPVVDVRWVVPSQTTRIGVDKLLPNNVSIAADGSGFIVSVPSVSVTRTLGQDCGQCAAANGFTVAKPAFVGNTSMSSSIPPEVSSATLTSGTLQLVVQNNYTFDPLRPSAASGSPKGYAVIIVSSGSNVIGKDSIDGATTALPSGGSLTRSIPLAGNISGATPVTASVTVNSPAGDPVLIDASRTFVVTASVPQGLKVANANVTVASKSVSSTSSIDLSSIDSTIIRKVQAGTLLLTVTNPFNITGSLTVTLTPQGGSSIVRTIPLAAGTSTPSVTFSMQEMQQLLGHVVSYTYAGAVSASGPVNVSPNQAVVVQTRLDLNLELGTIK